MRRLTLQSTVLRVTVERQVVSTEAFAVVALFTVTAEQDAVDVVE